MALFPTALQESAYKLLPIWFILLAPCGLGRAVNVSSRLSGLSFIAVLAAQKPWMARQSPGCRTTSSNWAVHPARVEGLGSGPGSVPG